jgi:hypothetical protein
LDTNDFSSVSSICSRHTGLQAPPTMIAIQQRN